MFKKIFPHAFVVFAFCLTFSLGYWQLERMQWKNDLLTKINARMDVKPQWLKKYQDLENDEFRLFRTHGKYLHNKEIKLLNRTYNGKPGVHVFTPLKNKHGIVLVNRGWVKDSEEYEKPKENMRIKGIIRGTQKANWISLENNPDKGQWFWVELEKMYKSIGVEPKEYYIDLKSTDDSQKSYPLPLPKEIKLHNEHLQYTITWFSLSIALLFIYYFRFWHKYEKS